MWVMTWEMIKLTLLTLAAFAAYFALMLGGAIIGCYVIGFIIGAIHVIGQVGVKNAFKRWDVLKAVVKDAHHNGVGFTAEIFGWKRHVIFVPR